MEEPIYGGLIDLNFWVNIMMIIAIVILIIFISLVILSKIGDQFLELPPANSTSEWKEILSNDNPCKWYQLGCQRLECIIDCNEINKNAGELICVC